MFLLLSSAWWGKQYYFRQDDTGVVYSRDSNRYMTREDAILEFVTRIEEDAR